MRRKPNPADLRAAAIAAEDAATALARAIGAATVAGVTVDDELTQCSAMLVSWTSWLAGLAAAELGDQS